MFGFYCGCAGGRHVGGLGKSREDGGMGCGIGLGAQVVVAIKDYGGKFLVQGCWRAR